MPSQGEKRRANTRRVYVDQAGDRQTLRGKTCVDCPQVEKVCRREPKVIKVRYFCTLSGLYVCKCKTACTLFPLQVGWTVMHV